jgi:hypothetical protein
MNKSQLLKEMMEVANNLDNMNMRKEANAITQAMIKVAQFGQAKTTKPQPATTNSKNPQTQADPGVIQDKMGVIGTQLQELIKLVDQGHYDTSASYALRKAYGELIEAKNHFRSAPLSVLDQFQSGRELNSILPNF